MFDFEIVINNWVLIRIYFGVRGQFIKTTHAKLVLFNYEINPIFEWKYYTKYRMVR